MLNFFRKFTKSRIGLVVVFAFLAIIAIAFAASDITGVSSGVTGGGGKVIAEVDGIKITDTQVKERVDRLIRDGYVQRTANTDDRRIINIQATTEGKKLIRQIRSDMRKSFETRFEAFPAEKVETFLSSVDECLSFLKEMDA